MPGSPSDLTTRSFFFSSKRRHTRYWRDWSSDVCSSDLHGAPHVVVCTRENEDGRSRFQRVWRPGLRWSRHRLRRRSRATRDRKSVVEGKSVDLGGRRILKKKKHRRRYS